MLVEGFLVIAELVRPVHGPDSQVVGEREFVQMGPIQRANASSIATANCQCPVPG